MSVKKYEVKGQGITRDFKYVGDYDAIVDFGMLAVNDIIEVINKLPNFTNDDFESGLCPPSVMISDELGSNLVIYRDPDADTFSAYYSGEKEGDAGSNLSINGVKELIIKFLKGEELEVKEYEVKTDHETLVYIPTSTIEYEDEWISKEVLVPIEVIRKLSDGKLYVRVWTSRSTYDDIPLNDVIEVKLSRGGFFSRPCVEVKFMKEGKKKTHLKCLNKKQYRNEIPNFAKELTRFLPSKVKVK